MPISRMEIGRQQHRAKMAEASAESQADVLAAYVPRRLFGNYVEERTGAAVNTRSITGLTPLRGEAVRMLRQGQGVLLTDGREVAADIVVLAMGNLPCNPARPSKELKLPTA